MILCRFYYHPQVAGAHREPQLAIEWRERGWLYHGRGDHAQAELQGAYDEAMSL